RTTLESRPAPKRKSTLNIEDDFMRENPELYGLRRSVRVRLSDSVRSDADVSPKSRPTQRRTIVGSQPLHHETYIDRRLTRSIPKKTKNRKSTRQQTRVIH